MFYLSDYNAEFAYQEPSEKYWNKLQENKDLARRIKKQKIEGLKGKKFRELLDKDDIERLKYLSDKLENTFREPDSKTYLAKNKIGLLNDLIQSRADTSLSNEQNSVLIDNLKAISKRSNKFQDEATTFKERANELSKKLKNSETSLRNLKRIGLGTLGIAGLGALTYGINKLRKTRSDKGKIRGKYKK